MKLNELSLRDRNIFCRHLLMQRHELSVYSFENIYIWKSLFVIKWAVIAKSLCVFFRDKIGAFLYLPPLAKGPDPAVIKEVFKGLDRINKNTEISRIENAEARDVDFYRSLGFCLEEKSVDYVYSRQELAELRGGKFRHKRAGCNHFIKNYQHRFLPYAKKDRDGCLRLYKQWAADRRRVNPDKYYRAMLEDNFSALDVLLRHCDKLKCAGRVAKIGGRIKGFTFGCELDPETFCVQYEITDLSVKGLAQFIFRSFCQELKDYKYINIMDDSGLQNLRRVKLSYRPVKLVPAYIVKIK